jgi:D-alanyl-D-alanine carboxypeptidase
MKDFPQYYHYFSTQSFRYKGMTYNSHNRMVRNISGVDGLKTGFIRASGFNVATSAKRGNRRVVGVVMGGQSAASRDQHMAQLLDRCFTQSVMTKSVRNVSNMEAAPAVAMRASMSAPISKPASSSQRTLEPAMMQPPTQAKATVASQRAAGVDSNNSWGIQIGSYQLYDRAQAQAQAVTRWVAGEVVVTEVEVRNRKLYRAQLVGLQRNEAHTACQSLVRQGIGCLVVRS